MSFGVRLNKVILSKYKNVTEFVETTGLGRTLVDSYLKGKTIPSIKKVEEFSRLLGISAAWLAYGVDVDENAEDELIDLINLIHNKVDEWLNSRNKEMDLDKKSILVKLIYKKLQLAELQKLSQEEVNQSIDDIIEIIDAA